MRLIDADDLLPRKFVVIRRKNPMRVWYDAEKKKPPRSEDDPTESVVVLVVDKYGSMYTATYDHELGWWEEAYCYGNVDVSYWQHLPMQPVQCKDCKKAQMGYEKPHLIWCGKFDNVTRRDDFCSMGERKER